MGLPRYELYIENNRFGSKGKGTYLMCTEHKEVDALAGTTDAEIAQAAKVLKAKHIKDKH